MSGLLGMSCDMRLSSFIAEKRRNVEIKARVSDLPLLFTRVRSIADSGPTLSHQDDTFYRVPWGRLKLRRFAEGDAVLVLYDRPDRPEAKESRYCLIETCAPEALGERLSRRYGICGRVMKERMLFLVGNTRVHLDRVKGLGQFVELEVVLKGKERVESGIETAQRLMKHLGISNDALIDKAYVDLLNGR